MQSRNSREEHHVLRECFVRSNHFNVRGELLGKTIAGAGPKIQIAANESEGAEFDWRVTIQGPQFGKESVNRFNSGETVDWLFGLNRFAVITINQNQF